jgi:hypothetical protein
MLCITRGMGQEASCPARRFVMVYTPMNWFKLATIETHSQAVLP